MNTSKRTHKKKRLGDTKPPEVAGKPRKASDTYVGSSNFDELTPEQQEGVRELFARFFISIYFRD
jgi:hypothetical protein